MIYSFLFLFFVLRKKCYEIKRIQKKNNLLDGIFYLENRTEKCEKLEFTEDIKLGYGVTAGKT